MSDSGQWPAWAGPPSQRPEDAEPTSPAAPPAPPAEPPAADGPEAAAPEPGWTPPPADHGRTEQFPPQPGAYGSPAPYPPTPQYAPTEQYGQYAPTEQYGQYAPPSPPHQAGPANPPSPPNQYGPPAAYGQPAPYGQPPSYGQPAPAPYSAPAGYDQQATTSYDYGNANAAGGYAAPQYAPPGGYDQSGGYGPPPGGYGQPGGAGQPPAKGRSKGKLALIIGLIVVVVAGLGVGTWAVFFRSSPTVTWQGKDIANPAGLLSQAQNDLTTLVSAQKGASNKDTRCYYAEPKTKPASGKQTDVASTVYCGPALFVDGDTSKPYIAYQIDQSAQTGGKVTLAVVGAASFDAAVAAPSGDKLVRPDGKTAPSGSGGLKVPEPPAADKDILTTVTGLDLPAAPATAAMGALDAGVKITKLGVVKRYGKGTDARSAPAGEKLIGFALADAKGDTSNDGDSSLNLQIVVDGGTPRPVPDLTATNVIAVPTSAKTVDLVTAANGVNQSLSLLDGKPGAGNIQVLGRDNRSGTYTPPATLTFTESGGGDSVQQGTSLTGSVAGLFFWADDAGTAAASAPTKAFLELDLTYTLLTDSPPPFTGGTKGDTGTLPAVLLSITLPDGTKVQAASVADHTVFEVPADFTTGTIAINGTYTNANQVSLSVPTAVTFPVTIS